MAGITHHAPAISDAPTAPAKAMPAHLCIGCVPPSSWRAGTLAAPLLPPMPLGDRPLRALIIGPPLPPEPPPPRDRKRVVQVKSVSVRLDLGVRRTIKKKTKNTQ